MEKRQSSSNVGRLRAPFFAIILIIGILPLLNGCGWSRRGHITSRLEAIEQLLPGNPDSALTLLSLFPVDSISYQADSMLYTLLLAQARARTGEPSTSADTLRHLVEYYNTSKGNHQHRLMYANYTLGLAYLDSSRYNQAILPLLDAERLAIATEDYFTLGLIYRQIAQIHGAVFNNVEGYKYSLKAVESFKKAGNDEYANYEQCNVAVCLNNLFRYQEALTLLEETERTAIGMHDTITIMNALEIRGISLLGLHRWKESLDCYLQLEQMGYEFENELYREHLVIAYERLGKIKEADSILKLQQQQGNQLRVGLHSFYASKSNYKSAYENLKYIHKVQDSLFRNISAQQVSEKIAYYNSTERYRQRLEANNRQQKLIMAICFVVFLSIMIVLGLVIRKRFLEKRLSELVIKSEILLSRLMDKDEKTDRQLLAWKQLLKKRYSTLGELLDEYYSTPERKRPPRLAVNIDGWLQALRENKSEKNYFVEDVFSEINKYQDNLISQMLECDHNFNTSDLSLLALIIAGFSNQAIGFILETEVTAIYSRKKRLKQKIQNLNYARKAEVLELM